MITTTPTNQGKKIMMRHEEKTTSLGEQLAELVVWFVAVGREFWVQKVLRRPEPVPYVGRHRRSALESTYREVAVDATTTATLVKTRRSWRTPLTVLRSHLPSQRAKEDALRDTVFTGTVTAQSVALITAVTLYLQQADLYRQALHPTGGVVC